MDPKTGRIYELGEREALALGMVPIPEAELESVRKMSTAQRLDWAEAKARLYTHPAALAPGSTEEDERKARNARKRERRGR